MRALILALSVLPGALRAEAPNVVTDIAPVHGLVATVMEGVGTPTLLIPPGASPHSYALRPSDARGLAKADLVVWVGHGLTPWLEDPLGALAPDAAKLELLEAEGMRVLGFREGAGFDAHDHDHGGHDDHEDHEDHAEDAHDQKDDHDKDHAHAGEHEEGHDHGEAHAEDKHDHDAHTEEEHAEHAEKADHDEHAAHEGGDPHIWLDPENGAVALAAIADTLMRLDPENAATYAANSKAAQARLAALRAEIDSMLAPARGQPFVVFHDAYHYFEARFDFEATAAVSTGDAATPGAARIAAVREHIAESGAVCAFAEPQMNTSLLETVVEGQKTRLGLLDPLGASLEPGPMLYENLLRAMAAEMGGCLSPQG